MLYLKTSVENGIISLHPLNPDEMYYKCEVCGNFYSIDNLSDFSFGDDAFLKGYICPQCEAEIRLMFLLRNEYPITALFHSTMLRITTKQSFQDSCSCKFRKNSFVEHTLKLKTERPRESTVASTHYRVLSTVASVETFSEEWLGRPGVHHTTNGDVPVELRRVRRKAVMPMPSVKQRFRMQW